MSKIRHRSGKNCLKKYGRDGVCRMTTPSWWINLSMTRKQRVLTRKIAKQLIRTQVVDIIDHPFFPLGKKPHNYYW
jgi:hypothetical protein